MDIAARHGPGLPLPAEVLSSTGAGDLVTSADDGRVFQEDAFQVVAAAATTVPAPKPFRLYYNFTFANQPQGLDKCGLTRLPLLTASYFFKGGKIRDEIDTAYIDSKLEAIRKAAAGSADRLAAVNVEGSWSIKRTDQPAVVRQKTDRYIALHRYLKQKLGTGLRYGIYGEAPVKDFFGYQSSYFGNPASMQYAEFLQAPPLLARANAEASRLGEAVDALFPAYYVNWYDDVGATAEARRKKTLEVWTTMVQRSMKLALQWKKPVYPFIWMQFHNKLNQPALANKLLPRRYFGHQLDTLKKQGASGVVIWGTLGPNGTGRATFDRNADWWREYLAFAKANGANLTKCQLLPTG